MTGIIVTGHGSFATGITSAIELLAGKQDFLAGVDFLSEHSEETLKDNLRNALNRFSQCGRIYILCDLLGGSPFKNAVTLCFQDQRVRVLYGTNLGMAVELFMRCMTAPEGPEDPDTWACDLIDTGRRQIGVYRYETADKEEEPEDGI